VLFEGLAELEAAYEALRQAMAERRAARQR